MRIFFLLFFVFSMPGIWVPGVWVQYLTTVRVKRCHFFVLGFWRLQRAYDRSLWELRFAKVEYFFLNHFFSLVSKKVSWHLSSQEKPGIHEWKLSRECAGLETKPNRIRRRHVHTSKLATQSSIFLIVDHNTPALESALEDSALPKGGDCLR